LGRTVPSFRIVLAEEKQEWKPFRNALDKSERKDFDEMWDIPRLYVSACSNSVQLVPLQPIITSILFNHYKELKECIAEVEQLRTGSNRTTIKYSSKDMELKMIEEEEQKEEIPTTLDEYRILYEYDAESKKKLNPRIRRARQTDRPAHGRGSRWKRYGVAPLEPHLHWMG
jgi:hypothetical protein